MLDVSCKMRFDENVAVFYTERQPRDTPVVVQKMCEKLIIINY